MKCLVTGATGFLGTNLVHELVNKGWDIRALRRQGSEIKYLKELPVEIVFGDVTSQDDMDRAVQGMDVVFHVAGDTSWWNKNFERQRRTNVDGPVNVARSCLKHGVKRLIHTSTCDTLGYNPSGLADETWNHYNYYGMGYNYGDTKREGENRVREFIDKGLDVIVVHPGGMIGPYDFTIQYGRLFFDLRDGKLPGCPIGGDSVNHVREVAKAHIAAAEKGKPGESYICAGVNLTHRELFQAFAEKVGKSAPRMNIPRWATVAYGYIMEFISSITNKPPEINPGMARYISVYSHYDSSKAIRELDYKIVPISEMINDAYNWYKENGYL